jgi:conjugal transfer pilus assembly protein TraW
MRLVALLLPALVAIGAAGDACAQALGKIGPTYPIGEEDLLAFIQERLAQKARSGELLSLQHQAQERARTAINSPAPVDGLHRTAAPRTFYFDPSYVLERNAVDAQGRVLFPAGTVANPLDIVTMSKHLLFFDARDDAQVRRARDLIAAYGGRMEPILVGGSYLQLMRQWRIAVYYDQEGVLVRRLGITAVPAIVSQEGRRLRIDELAVVP